MSKPGRTCGLLVAGLLLAGTAARAEIYRWTDAQGHVHYTQDLSQVPGEHRTRAKEGAATRAEQPSPVQTYKRPLTHRGRLRQSGRARPLHIPFRRVGSSMLVMVKLNDRVTVPFLVDTGASDVAIPTKVALQAGISVGPETPRVIYQTANGPVSQPVVVVDSVQIGEVRVEGLRGSISDAMQVGLLGGSFFNNFTFQVDPAAQVITLVPNGSVRSGLSERQWRGRYQDLRGRIARLQDYLQTNHFTRQSRITQLEHNLETLQGKLRDLDRAADLASVPHTWRQ